MTAAPVERIVAGEIQPSHTMPGVCHSCGEWSDYARVVAEIDRDCGAGAIVLRCPGCDQAPLQDRSETDPFRGIAGCSR